MGIFSRKKKTTSIGSPSPAQTSTSQLPTALPAPQVILEPVEPPMTLSVVLDGWTYGREVQRFSIQISKDADTTTLRQVLSNHIGNVSMSLFKVNIPKLAAEQARTYTETYRLPVDLVAAFPAFNLDDPEQLVPSLGPAGWQLLEKRKDLKMKDWFSEPVVPDIITLLVRRADGPSSSIPLTFAIHLAQPGAMSRANRPTTPGGTVARAPPTVVDVLPGASVAELKSAILAADSRSVEHSDSLVLWRVEMTEDEMIVIEERGGLKNGQMPWPYPPCAPVPSGMTDSSLPITQYFPSFTSNLRMITISAYIPSTVPSLQQRSIPAEAEAAPSFKYPMTFAAVWSPATSVTFTLKGPPSRASPRQSPDLGSTPKVASRGRARPSTAPVQSAVPSFGSLGSRRLNSRPNVRSPLIESTTPKGLGINTTMPDSMSSDFGLDQHRGSTSSNVSETPSNVESDTSSVPSLDFSVLSLDGSPSPSPSSSASGTRSAVQTPVTEKSEWLQVNPGLVVPKGLERANSMQRVTKWGRLAGKIHQ